MQFQANPSQCSVYWTPNTPLEWQLSCSTGGCSAGWVSWQTAWLAWTTSWWLASTTCGKVTTTWAGGTTRWALRATWRWSSSSTGSETSPQWRFRLSHDHTAAGCDVTWHQLNPTTPPSFSSRSTVTTCSPAGWRSSPPSPAGLSPASLRAGRRSRWRSRRCWTTGTRAPATWRSLWTAAPPSPSAAAFTLLTSGWCSARSPFSRVTHGHKNKRLEWFIQPLQDFLARFFVPKKKMPNFGDGFLKFAI